MPNNLKFRAWDLKLKKFNYFDLTCCLPVYGNSDEFSVDIWSGLKDKDGRDIYKNDIIIFMGRWDEKGNVLEPDYRPYEVCWFGSGLHAIIRSCHAFPPHNYKVGVGHTDNKVIGNVYENRELLK